MKKSKLTGLISLLAVGVLGGLYIADSVGINVPYSHEIITMITGETETTQNTSTNTKDLSKPTVTFSENIDILEQDESSNGVLSWNEIKNITSEVYEVDGNKSNFTKEQLEPYKKDVEDSKGNIVNVPWGWVKLSEMDNIKGEYDKYGRVHQADSLFHQNSLPQETRESISNVSPTGWLTYGKNSKGKEGVYGWNSIKGNQSIEGKTQAFYNRGHLLGHQMSGLNAEPRNLITMARKTNAPLMVKYENEVTKYLKSTENYVRYQVTPIYKDNEIVARAVQMRAKSIDIDPSTKEEEIDFNVVIMNENPGFDIDYSTGNFEKK